MDDIRVFLFFYLVQTGIMVYVGLALFNIKLPRMRLALCTAILGLSLWLLRGAYALLGIPFGTHTLVLTLIFILVIKFVGGQNWGIATGATLVTMTLVTIGGGASQVFVQVFKLTPQQILASVWLHILMGYVESVFLFVMLLLNKVFGFTIVNYLDIE
ncbi:MAG TPA: hypothetical protein GX691_08450 [Clostridia bacterium]|jgi:hypothetical protein|nr:hypothetical protein [Clostridia bacterium]